MAADASIYGMIRPPTQGPSPIEQYGQVMGLKNMMGQQELHGLQTEQLRKSIADDAATEEAYKASGGDLVKLKELLYGRGLVKPAMAAEKNALEVQEKTGNIAKTKAQTADITAGHIAGAWGALAKGGGTDQAVLDAQAMMEPLVGPEKAAAVTAKLMSMPPEVRLAYAVGQAGTHKTGQEAIKLFFPQAHMQDLGGTVQPVSTSTIPGGPAAGSAIPGAQPLTKTATIGETETMRHNPVMEANAAGQLGVARGNLGVAQNRLAFESDPARQAAVAGAKEGAKTIAESQANSQIRLPQTIATAEQNVQLINQMIGGLNVNKDGKLERPEGSAAPHAGFQGVIGGTLLPGARFIPGTEAASFQTLLDQVKGGAFLQAFESLKGGGAITEIEGAKATNAITRMSSAQSEKEFVKAAREYEDVIKKGVERAKAKATPSPGAGGIRFLGYE